LKIGKQKKGDGLKINGSDGTNEIPKKKTMKIKKQNPIRNCTKEKKDKKKTSLR